MPIVNFGSFSKRRNSTKQPGGLSDTRNCKLKETTSFDAPTFIITGDDFNYNYAQWGNRYYFITDIRSVHNGLTEIDCEIDVLATYKSEILNTTAYVIYDSTPNTELPDNRLPIKTSKTVQAATAACPFTVDGGTYILSITGSNNSTGVYKVTESQLAALLEDVAHIADNLFDFAHNTPVAPTKPSNYDVGEWLEYIGDYLAYMMQCAVRPIAQFFGSFNAPQNIRDCRFIPFNVGVTGSPIPIYLGSFLTQQSLGKLVTETVHRSTTVNIPWQATDYRRRSPFTEIYLYLPYIGMTKLSSENLVGQTSITVDYTLALRDGGLICTISSGGEILGQFNGNVGASVPVGVSNISLPNAAQALIATAASVATDSLAAFGMASIQYANAVTPNFTCIGGLDGLAATGANQNITCYTVYHDTIAPPNQNLQVIGSPTMHSKSLGSLTGYCQCVDAHVEADAMGHELEEIDSFLNSGFFIE